MGSKPESQPPSPEGPARRRARLSVAASREALGQGRQRLEAPSPPLPQDEYQFCYQAALEYLGSFDHYAT